MKPQHYLSIALALFAGAAGGRLLRHSSLRSGGSAANAATAPGSETGAAEAAPTRRPPERRTSSASMAGGAPFLPGQAGAWLEGMADAEFSGPADFRMLQQLAGIDARSAEELALECLRLSHPSDGDDDTAPPERPHPKGYTLLFILMQATVRLADLNPAKAAGLMRSDESKGSFSEIVAPVYSMIARRDPELALRSLASLPDDDRAEATAACAMEWISKDPARALKALDSLPDSESTRSECLVKLARTDPAAALTDAWDRMTRLSESSCLGALMSAQPEIKQEAFDRIASYTGADAGKVKQDFLADFASADVDKAMGIYQQLAGSGGIDLGDCAYSVARVLNEQRPEALQGWLDQLPQDARQTALSGIVANALASHGAGDSETELAETRAVFPGQEEFSREQRSLGPSIYLLNQMTPSEGKDGLVAKLIPRLSEVDPEEALKWVATLPEGPQRDLLQRRTEVYRELKSMGDVEVEPADPLSE